MDQFQPHRLLRNAHLMTLAGALLPRRVPALPRAVRPPLRSRTRNATARALPLAARSAPVPRFGRRAWPRRLQRIRLHARLGVRRLRRRLQRAPHQPAQLRRHRTAHAHALQFRPERRLPRRSLPAHRARRAAANLLRRLLHGRQSRPEDGRRIGRRYPAAASRRLRRLSHARSRRLRRRHRAAAKIAFTNGISFAP